jgi:uncharacterized OB-fold protein
MKEFLNSLKEGKFRIPVCASCSLKVWPPSNQCPRCFSETLLQEMDSVGTLVEFASSQVISREGFFGVIDIQGIRIMGALKTRNLSEGTKMKMSGCGLREDGSPFYDFEPAETRH